MPQGLTPVQPGLHGGTQMRSYARLLAVLGGGLALVGGCADLAIVVGGNKITVELYNDTDLVVRPDIQYDDDSGGFDEFLAGVFGGQELASPALDPGEVIQYDFDCDELGLIFSDNAEQISIFGIRVAEANRSDILRQDEDFDCGAVIQFRFLGERDDFGVVVSVNGKVVD